MRQALSLRIDQHDLEQIDQQARAFNLTRTKYIVDKLLDRIGSTGLDHRVDDLEQRMRRAEAALYGGDQY